MLRNLINTFVELGVEKSLAENIEMAHHRNIRATVENQPSTVRIAELMDNYRDEFGDKMADTALAHGAIMYFSRYTQKVSGKTKERIGKNKDVQAIVAEFQENFEKPEYDILSVEEEIFDL